MGLDVGLPAEGKKASEREGKKWCGEDEWGLGVAWLNATRTQALTYAALAPFLPSFLPTGRGEEETWIGLDWDELHG